MIGLRPSVFKIKVLGMIFRLLFSKTNNELRLSHRVARHESGMASRLSGGQACLRSYISNVEFIFP